MSSSALAPASSPKKRKHHGDADAGPSTKKSKKERKHKRKHAHQDEEFILVQASLVVSIPPVFASNPAQGVEEMLDSMVMRYIPTLRGVVLTHSNLRFLQSTAQVQGDSPYAVCNVGFDATVWSPRVGQRLTGKVNLCSPDHVSLLVHRTFNVSIPRHHIPQTDWVFEYGPAENDPEYGAGSAAARDAKLDAEGGSEEEVTDVVMNEDNAQEDDQNAHAAESSGRWVHSLTDLPLGGDSATLEFTVIGMTIANQMLSLVGSIQPNPFSPEHVAPAQDVHAPAEVPPPVVDEVASDNDSEPELDIFAELGRITDRTAAEENKRRKQKEKSGDKASAKAEKKKRKKDVDGGESKGKNDTGGEARKREKRKASDDQERKPKKKKKTSERQE